MATYDAVASIDTLLNEAAATTNYGSNSSLEAGSTSGKTGEDRRSILYFDLSSLVALGVAGSAVTAVTLGFYASGLVGTAVDHALHKIWGTTHSPSRQDWVEAEATWNIYKTSNNWTTAGGDYETATPTPHTWTPTGGAPGLNAQTIPDGANFRGLVADALDNENGALHVLWKQNDESTGAFKITFASSEDATPGRRPTIHITYTSATTRRIVIC